MVWRSEWRAAWAVWMLLAWTVGAPAATYYVSKAGNDSNDGSQATPWLTVGKAVDTILDGDTVIIGDGVYNENNDGSNNLKLNRAFSPNGVVLAAEHPHSGSAWNVTLTGNSGSCNNIYFSAAAGVTFKEVQFAPLAGSNNQHVLIFGGGNKKLRFVNCDINNPSTQSARGAMVIVGTGNSYTLEFLRCSFSARGTNAYVIRSDTTKIPQIDNLIFNQCTISSTGGSECGLVAFQIGMNGVLFDSCTFVQSGKLTGRAIGFGNDGATLQSNPLSAIKLKHCSITTETSSHVLLVGGNAHGSTVDGCTIVAPKADYGIVIKCATGVSIRNNIINGPNNGLITRASFGFEINNNIFSTIMRGIEIDPYFGITPTLGSGDLGEIYNNIFLLSGNPNPTFPSYAIMMFFSGQTPNCLIDYNCSWLSGKGNFYPVYIDGVGMSLEQAHQYWVNYGQEVGRTSNHSHSMVANPMFADPALADPKLKPISPCINAGRPTQWGGATTMGVWQPEGARPARMR